MKSLLAVGALGLASLGIASASSNEIVLEHKTMVGAATLRPGIYRVSEDGNGVVFKRRFSKEITVPATVSQNDRTFEKVVMHTAKNGKTRYINEIDLGGTNTRLEFNQ